jgi:hypothetical protein
MEVRWPNLTEINSQPQKTAIMLRDSGARLEMAGIAEFRAPAGPWARDRSVPCLFLYFFNKEL